MIAPGRARPCAAFTIVELVTVVALLSLAALVVMPDSRPMQGAKLDLAASEFADAVRFARGEALRTGQLYGFTTIQSQNRLRVYRVETVAPPVQAYDVYHPVSKRLYDIDLDEEHPVDGVSIDSRAASWTGICNLPTHVVFDGNGIPRCADPIDILLQSAYVRVAFASSTLDVVLDGETGRVTVQ